MEDDLFSSPFSSDVGFYSLRLSSFSSGSSLVSQLHPTERRFLEAGLASAPPLEFCLGRIAARKALFRLCPGLIKPLLERKNGTLIWPAGIVGSISYSDSHAIAAVARERDALSLGLDIKPLRSCYGTTPLRYESHESPVMEAGEEPGKSYSKLLCLYSAKQSVVNALRPLCSYYVSYLDILLRWDNSRRIFRGLLQRSLGPKLPEGLAIEVGCIMRRGYVLSHFSLRPSA